MPVQITPLPIPPSRQDPINFPERGDNFLGALPTFAEEENALAAELNANAILADTAKTQAQSSATTAAQSASAAQASANSAAANTNAPLWVSGTNYAAGFLVYSNLTARTYRRLIAGAGTTDPSLDAVNWKATILDVAVQKPSVRPSLLLDFANSKRKDSRISFSRGTAARYYDGRTSAKSEENLLLYSQDFTNGIWSKGQTSTGNFVVAPDGTSTATELQSNGTNNPHFIQQNVSVNNTQRVFSVYAKAGTESFVQLRTGTDTAIYANFNLSLGTIGTTAGCTAEIEASAQGFYRISINFTSATATAVVLGIVTSGTAVRNETNTLSGNVIIWGSQLEHRAFKTFYAPTTNLTVTQYVPALLQAGPNDMRFRHDPITKESRGLMNEPQRSNLLLYSADFANAYWSKNNSSIVSNTAISPTGEATADKLVTNTATQAHSVSRQSTYTTGTYFVMSCYAKAAEYTRVRISSDSTPFAEGQTVSFDLIAGTFTVRAGSSTASIEAVGNGWYRCIVQYPITVTNGTNGISTISVENAAGSSVFAGDDFSGIFLFGVQLEVGRFATSYIETTASQVTRNAEQYFISGANLTSWFNNDEGTLYYEGSIEGFDPTLNPSIVQLQGQSTARIGFFLVGAGPNVRASISSVTAGETFLQNVASLSTIYMKNKYALAYNQTSANSAGRLTNTEDTSVHIPLISQLNFSSSNGYCGTISKIAFYPKKIAEAELRGAVEL